MNLQIDNWLNNYSDKFNSLSNEIWNYAELGLKEFKSAKALENELKSHGFNIESGIAGLPTAFKATWGSGKPVIGFLGEYDALAGLSQVAGANNKEYVIDNGPGHGCGHNLLGVGSMAAAIALKESMQAENITGTVVYYGCPAEETFIGKVYMAKKGYFQDLDVAFCWHPDRVNMVVDEIWQAVICAKFDFKGKTSHAATEPEQGRSSLDAVQLMNTGVEYLREHIIDAGRIHYVITNGGVQPNVVPAEAQVWYYVRAPKKDQAKAIFERVLKVGKGAAMMTETEMNMKFITGCPQINPNDVLAKTMSDVMMDIEFPQWTNEEYTYAKEVSKTFAKDADQIVFNRLKVAGYKEELSEQDKLLFSKKVPYIGLHPDIPGSSDVADVSWCVPTAQVLTACNVFATSDHTWQYTAAAGSSIGNKGAMFAAKVLAQTGYRLLKEPELINKAKQEFNQRTDNKDFESLVPDGTEIPFDQFK